MALSDDMEKLREATRLPRIKCERGDCGAVVGLWYCEEWEMHICPPCTKAEAEERVRNELS